MKVGIVCMSCGNTGDVDASLLARTSSTNKLRCQKCGSDDLDLNEKTAESHPRPGTHDVVRTLQDVEWVAPHLDAAQREWVYETIVRGSWLNGPGTTGGIYADDPEFQKVVRDARTMKTAVWTPKADTDLDAFMQWKKRVVQEVNRMTEGHWSGNEVIFSSEDLGPWFEEGLNPPEVAWRIDDLMWNGEHTSARRTATDDSYSWGVSGTPGEMSLERSNPDAPPSDPIKWDYDTRAVSTITQRLRCSSCLHEWTREIEDPAEPMPHCSFCGAEKTVSAAGATGVSPRVSFLDPHNVRAATHAMGQIIDYDVENMRVAAEQRKHTEVTASILATNPTMNVEDAQRLAQETIARYPSMVSADDR